MTDIRRSLVTNKAEREKIFEAGLSEIPARHRASLTGIRRNESEAKRFRSLLEGALSHWHFGRTAEALRLLNNVQKCANDVGHNLIYRDKPKYASVEIAIDGEARSLEDALAVASANVRRAIGAGHAIDAKEFIVWMIDRIKG